MNKELGRIETQSDEIGFGTLSAEIKPATSGFFHNDEYDLESPTDGFASILDTIEDIRKGKVCFWWALAYWLDNRSIVLEYVRDQQQMLNVIYVLLLTYFTILLYNSFPFWDSFLFFSFFLPNDRKNQFLVALALFIKQLT